jgi:hypothetical protein
LGLAQLVQHEPGRLLPIGRLVTLRPGAGGDAVEFFKPPPIGYPASTWFRALRGLLAAGPARVARHSNSSRVRRSSGRGLEITGLDASAQVLRGGGSFHDPLSEGVDLMGDGATIQGADHRAVNGSLSQSDELPLTVSVMSRNPPPIRLRPCRAMRCYQPWGS